MAVIKAQQGDNVKEMKLLFKEIFHCMKVISQNEQPENQRFFENEAQMQAFGSLMKKCLECVNVNKEHQLATIEERNRNHQIDEEDEAEIKEELYKITSVATYINECATIIMSTYKGEATATIDANVKFYYAKVLQEYKVVSDRELQDATYFFMEYVEHCAKGDAMMVYELCTQYAEIAMWSKPDMVDVRQNAVYGIGCMAKHLNQAAFKSLIDVSMKAVEHVLSDVGPAPERHLPAAENAYVTLARLALLHTHDATQVTRFLEAMPLKGDEEAQEAHQFLFEQVLQNHPVLMGACKPAMLKAVIAIKEAHA